MKKINYFSILLKIINFLSYRRKITLLIYLGLSIISGLVELISIAMVIPFISLVLNPGKALNYFEKFGVYLEDYIIFKYTTLPIFIGIIFIILIFTSAVFRIFLLYLGQKTSSYIIYEFNILTYKKILNINDSSSKHLNENNLLTSLQKTINLSIFFFNFNSIFSNLIIFIFIFSIICFLMPFQIFILGGVFIFIYYLIISFFKSELLKNSKIETELYSKKNIHVINTVGFHKELILNDLKRIFLENFKKYTYKFAKIAIANNSIAFLPGIILVNFTIIILVIYILWVTTTNNSLIDLIPSISAIVYGTQKIIPLLQLIYSSSSRLKDNYYQTESFISFLNSFRGIYKENENNYRVNKLLFKKEILFKKIDFKYPNKNDYVIKDLNLLIRKGDKILITGKSGIGKCSLINIITITKLPSRITSTFTSILLLTRTLVK